MIIFFVLLNEFVIVPHYFCYIIYDFWDFFFLDFFPLRVLSLLPHSRTFFLTTPEFDTDFLPIPGLLLGLLLSLVLILTPEILLGLFLIPGLVLLGLVLLLIPGLSTRTFAHSRTWTFIHSSSTWTFTLSRTYTWILLTPGILLGLLLIPGLALLLTPVLLGLCSLRNL